VPYPHCTCLVQLPSTSIKLTEPNTKFDAVLYQSTQNLSTGMHYIPVLALYRGDMQRRGSLVRSSISRASPDEWCATVAQIVELPQWTSVATIEANIALRLASLCALRLSNEINGYRIAQ
jgi:hypothetical protein